MIFNKKIIIGGIVGFSAVTGTVVTLVLVFNKSNKNKIDEVSKIIAVRKDVLAIYVFLIKNNVDKSFASSKTKIDAKEWSVLPSSNEFNIVLPKDLLGTTVKYKNGEFSTSGLKTIDIQVSKGSEKQKGVISVDITLSNDSK